MDAAERMRQELLEEFRETAGERAEKIVSCWLTIEQSPDDEQTAQEAMRQLHSLKGEAKMMGFADVSLVSHRVEELFAAGQARRFRVPAEFGDVLLVATDALTTLVKKRAGTAEQSVDLSELLNRIGSVLAKLGQEPEDVVAEPEALPHKSSAPVARSDDRLRVPIDVMTQFSESASELVILHRRFGHIMERLQRTLGGSNDSDAFERVQRKLESFAELLHEGELQAENIEYLARRMRLVPIGSLFRRYARAIRDLAKEHGKRIDVEMADGGIALDKIVIDRISEPLLHLVRNAVDHGVETPVERDEHGKSPSGRIVLEAMRKGALVVISVRDDGRGIDLEEVRRSAVDRGVAEREAAAAMDHEQLIATLFLAGFSTRKVTTETSGRGVGLDVVKREVESIGGTVRLETGAGLGCRFELSVPANVLLTRVLVVEVGGAPYALPLTAVERVLTIDEADVVFLRERAHVRVEEEILPIAFFSDALGSDPPSSALGHAVVVRHGTSTVAMRVERWQDVADVIVKTLGPIFDRTALFHGACVLRDAHLALVINPAELMARARPERADGVGAVVRSASPKILLAEDSAIMRAMVARALRAIGYEVHEAANGLEALLTLEKETADLVVTDIDMPEMDGIELIRRVRRGPRGSRLPIVVLSTHGSTQDREKALSAGADAYMVKSTFSERALGDLVARYLITRA